MGCQHFHGFYPYINSKLKEGLCRIKAYTSFLWMSWRTCIALRINNGVVTVIGFVDSNEDIQKINDKLKDIEGIRSVNNQLNVKSK